VTYERVHTISDFYDCPREGIADYQGRAHRFKCQWDSVADDWTRTFALTPIDETTLRLATEQWELWRAWERSFHAGRVPQSSHPGFGGKDARYDELEQLIAARLRDLEPLDVLLVADFRAVEGQQQHDRVAREFEVEWRSR